MLCQNVSAPVYFGRLGKKIKIVYGEMDRSGEKIFRIAGWLDEYKVGQGCKLCGYDKHPRALDFHHCNGDKELAIATLRVQGKSWSKINREIARCIVVCANCHREIHAGLHPECLPVKVKYEDVEPREVQLTLNICFK